MVTKLHQPKIGKLVLAGAGPGDAELITVKLQKQLAIADVILSDRLVNPAIVELYANKHAEVVLTGKQIGNTASCAQHVINDLIVHYALQGRNVLRLKGGDVAFYSNMLDELTTAAQHNIPYEIIPGITAAAGASAYAAIPLTARGYSEGVQFLSFNPKHQYTEEEWKIFAGYDDTLVLYMTARNIAQLAENLMKYQKPASTPLAVIEQASTVYQKVFISTLDECASAFAGKTFASPSLVIVGNVVQLHEQFNWFEPLDTEGSIFKELDHTIKVLS